MSEHIVQYFILKSNSHIFRKSLTMTLNMSMSFRGNLPTLKSDNSPNSLPSNNKLKSWYSTLDISPNLSEIPVSKRKVLVLDLDETLIHSSEYPPHPKVESFRCGNPEIIVHKRPGVDVFIQMATTLFDTYIYTYGTLMYADPILDELCPMIRQDHRLYRHRCTIKKGKVKKDLQRFNRPMSDVILIEDSATAKKQHPDNTILIPAWQGSPADRVLIDYLPNVLMQCSLVADVRQIIRWLNPKDCLKLQ
ncbi:CTD nuclear envelope phosphatase 1 [Tritrichomonas foetus]|uniref:Mitochondrial import inner membrane translocase subunit TIM50 n=1 Tax=Tritrichomonas foetus TaxID=1144522 RepID=A0A1J4JN21_9EUKA|nr:CTD nuclear envelope phosphatase 1 [Tritrichomonas foetus]|eukprot:OHS98939.1 CTD nuclear envelope phosphatase 1 [Tritrichomonas foetus]